MFDGISCGRVALERAGISVDKYYASEVKDIAIKVSKFNYPDIIHIGDVTKVSFQDGVLYTENGSFDVGKIDLLIGGSPCQDLSIAMKDRKGLQGEKSKLFYEYVRIFNEVKPKYFLLENVARMSDEDKDIISNIFGVDPIRINSSLLSAQLRDRNYWTNIENVEMPKDKGIKLQSILESGYVDRDKARALLVSDSRPLKDKKRMIHRYKNTGFTTIVYESVDMDENNIRYFTQIELERLQTLPVGYTQTLSRNDAANVLGDGWTVDVIAHIFSALKE